MDENRLKHSLAVANKMVELNKGVNKEDLFLIGYLHDIGYDFLKDNKNTSMHNKIGGEILRKSGFKYWKEVYCHGDIDDEYKSKYLDLLNTADMMIDSMGNDVGFEKRLEDILVRYGENSKVYINAKKLVENLKNKSIC